MKYSLFAKSSKYLIICSAIFFVSKLITMISASIPNQSMSTARLFSNITEISFYGFLILAYVALNRESTAHKRLREFLGLGSVKHLKRLVVYCFLSAFVKALIKNIVNHTTPDTVVGVFVRLLAAAALGATSLSFVLFAISLWYLKRDRGCKGLLVFEIIAVLFGVVYYVPKYISALDGYGVSFLSDEVFNAACSANALNAYSLIQSVADAVMFYAAYSYFSRLGAEEEEIMARSEENAKKCDSVYEPCGYGIDSFDMLYTREFAVENLNDDAEGAYDE